jgi:hypothetical protein
MHELQCFGTHVELLHCLSRNQGIAAMESHATYSCMSWTSRRPLPLFAPLTTYQLVPGVLEVVHEELHAPPLNPDGECRWGGATSRRSTGPPSCCIKWVERLLGRLLRCEMENTRGDGRANVVAPGVSQDKYTVLRLD